MCVCIISLSLLFLTELWEIAGKIQHGDTMNIGLVLGFPHSKITQLEGIYTDQPQKKNYEMLKKWCELVQTYEGDQRRCLAKILSQANCKYISDDMKVDITSKYLF